MKSEVTCEQCGVKFLRENRELNRNKKNGSRNFCSRSCLNKASHGHTTPQFIEKAKAKHGDKYLYGRVRYVNSWVEVEIVCKKHGVFKQLPCVHLAGSGCQECAKEICVKAMCDHVQREEAWNAVDLPDRDEFAEFYASHSYDEIAARYNVSKNTIARWREVLKLPHCTDRYLDTPATLTDEQRQIMVGSMLGDGCMKIRKDTDLSSFSFTQAVERRGYVQWMYEKLKPFSTNYRERQRESMFHLYDSVNNRQEYRYDTMQCEMATIRHQIFGEMEGEWYKRKPDGSYAKRSNGTRIKIIPENLVLTPLMVAVWYWDDGTNSASDRGITFYTNGFTFEECERLSGLLSALGIAANVNGHNSKRGQPTISVRAKHYIDFLDMVSPYLPDQCLYYKVDKSRYVEPKWKPSDVITKDVFDGIKARLAAGNRMCVIAKEMNVPYHTVGNIKRGLVSGKGVA